MGIRFYQSRVVADHGYQGVVEASAMRAAYSVVTEDPATPGHEQRMGVARSLFQGMPADITRFVRLFAWYCVFDPQVQGAVFDPATGTVTADRIDDEHVDTLILGFWDMAADYQAP